MNMNACSAGFARLEITPPLGVRIGGYYVVRETKGVLDPIYARAIAFREGDKTAVMIVCDLLGMYGPAAYEWPPMIAEKLGLPKEAVFLCHTHSHTTPVVTSYREPHDDQYDAWLYRRLCDVAQLAINDLKPVTDVRASETATEGIAYVRRYYMQDGTLRTNPPYSSPEQRAEIKEPAHEADRSLRLVRILREDGPELILVNYQMHPDNIGGELISADYPGAVCRRVEELAPGSHAVFMNGAEGQMVATNRITPTKVFNKYTRAMSLGTSLAEKAMEMYVSAPSTGMSGLSFGQKPVHAKTKRGLIPLSEAERIIELHEAGKNAEIHPIISTALSAQAYLIRELEKYEQDYIDFPVSAIAFCGVAFVGLPGEPFNEVGLQVRGNSKFPMTFIACQTNGCYGYFPIARAYDEGGYEPHNTRYVKGTAEQLADTADELLAEL